GSISMKAVKLEIGVLRPEAAGQEAGGKRKKEGARRSVFTNMRCSHSHPYKPDFLTIIESLKEVSGFKN
ncbi:MAG TPA: hypothetical protein VLA84_23810, partial [Microcoleus sp.]|nr:hypothetical protein [Microcoleus sp.]